VLGITDTRGKTMQYQIRISIQSKDGHQTMDKVLPWVEAADINAAFATVSSAKGVESPVDVHDRLVATQNAAAPPKTA
jgi:hypothetical protein